MRALRAFFLRRCNSPVRCAYSASSLSGEGGLLGKYKALVSSKKLLYDEHQFAVLKYLHRLSRWVEEEEVIVYPGVGIAGESSVPARGLYVYGEVGTGKTLLMDLFFKHCNVDASRKRRVHFHAFMLEVHQRIWAFKQELLRKHGRDVNVNLASERDAIAHVAKLVASEARVLCFDEFQVTDIADAMIISKFFSVLWQRGTVLVATSNRPPADLYQNGLNRQYFLPFVAELEQRCIVKRMGGNVDYRQAAVGFDGAYFSPIGEASRRALWQAFLAFPASTSTPAGSSGQKVEETETETEAETDTEIEAKAETEAAAAGAVAGHKIPVMMGRSLALSWARPQQRACLTSFAALCKADVGSSDYGALAAHFDAVYLVGVPVLSVLEHDQARRFITLVDALYDAGCLLVWTSDAPPPAMFRFLAPEEASEKLSTGSGGSAIGGPRLGTDHTWSAEWGGPHVRLPGQSGSGWRRTTAVNASKHTGLALQTSTANPVDAAQDELKLLEGELCSVQELAFAFRRASSRLTQMAGVEWRSNSNSRRAQGGL